MPALQLIVTNAGRAAIANAQHNGTATVLLAAAGVTATAFVADPTTAALPGEIKRIVTLSGGATAADTLHVTVQDDSTDTYSVRGLALYLDDGTLFASFGQADVLLQKSTQSALLVAMDVQFTDIAATDITVGDTNFQLNSATTEVQGIVELATDAEAVAGTDATRALVPKSLPPVLDARLGVSAPTGFVKTLLSAATAAAFRALLGLKAASTFDTGTGGGLDADLLDGQHGAYYRQYANLQGVPSSFPPSAHQHSADDITSGTLAVARGGTGAVSLAAGAYLLGNGANALALKTPAQVLIDIGAASKVHSHAWADINDPPATATRWPALAEVSGLQGALDAKAPTASPVFTGTAQAEAVQVVSGNDSSKIAMYPGPETQWNWTGDDWYYFQNLNNAGFYSNNAGYILRLRKSDKQVSCFGGLDVAGATVSAGGFQNSDRRLKRDIAARAVQSGLAAACADIFSQWTLKATGRADVGLIAQDLQRIAPHYVIEGPSGYLAIDKAGAALECAMDLAQQVTAQQTVITQLLSRLAALEKRA
jgi:hypothetical protein